jgi:hypothetical protein
MSTEKEKQLKKSDFSILFIDSPEHFLVERAKVIFEGPMVRFICFDEFDKVCKNIWYPILRIHAIKSLN